MLWNTAPKTFIWYLTKKYSIWCRQPPAVLLLKPTHQCKQPWLSHQILLIFSPPWLRFTTWRHIDKQFASAPVGSCRKTLKTMWTFQRKKNSFYHKCKRYEVNEAAPQVHTCTNVLVPPIGFLWRCDFRPRFFLCRCVLSLIRPSSNKGMIKSLQGALFFLLLFFFF